MLTVKELILQLELLDGDKTILVKTMDTDGCEDFEEFAIGLTDKDEPEDETHYYIW